MDYPGKVIRKTPVTPTQTSASGVWTVDDALQAVKTNTWPIAGVPNPISRSLRFNSADSAYLNRTPTTAGNRRTWTWSAWVKLGTIGNWGGLFNAGTSGDQFAIYLFTDSTLYVQDFVSPANNIQIQPTQVFRDPSAWYHIVVAIDTTQATSSNRVKVYINGSQVTAFSTSTYPSQNYDTQINSTSFAHNVGRNFQFATSTAKYFDGYMAEVNFIDGQQLAASDFGMTDPQTGQWVPKKYTGTYGTNGFYLNFSDNSSTGTLGYDYSGNSNNWTSNNFSVTAGAGNDSLTDVPTPWIAYNTTGDVGGVFRGNYCTANPLDIYPKSGTWTVSNGNLDLSLSGAVWDAIRGTTGVTSGKWYWEITATGINNTNSYAMVGIQKGAGGNWQDPFAYVYYSLNGQKYNNGSGAAYGNSWTTNDVIGVAFDADAGEIKFYKNNTVQNSGTAAFTGLTSGPYTPVIMLNGTGSAATVTCNFGQRPFAYTPPAGFRSLCTTNLPTPTIGATSTTQAGKYFNTVLYTGDSNSTGATRSVTGVGFQPDFVWLKTRTDPYSHQLYDAVRGTGSSKNLSSDRTAAEGDLASLYGYVSAFQTDGFQTTNGSSGTDSGIWVNALNENFVAWNWKAGGTGVSNTQGTITSTVSASTTAGFSVVTYTGNNTLAQSVGHGLGAAPSMIIVKSRSNATNWLVWHSAISINSVLLLNDTSAEITGLTGIWGSAVPTSTTFGLNRLDTDNNRNGQTYVAYCFAPIAGYSAFGSYTGNGSTDGTFVYTGFRPEFVMVKNISAISYWQINDAARNPYNLANLALHPNTSGAEATYSNAVMDILSNGFKLRGNDTYTNTNGNIYIYAAFAEFPFKFSNAR